MWNGPFAYGSAVVTNSWRRGVGDEAEGTAADIGKTLHCAGESTDSSKKALANPTFIGEIG